MKLIVQRRSQQPTSPYKPLFTQLPSQEVAATILAYYGPFLKNIKVFLWQLSLNARAYSVKHSEQLKAFCSRDPRVERILFDFELRSENKIIHSEHMCEKYSELFKSRRIMKGDNVVEREKASGLREMQLYPGERMVVEFNMPWELANLEQCSGVVEVIYRQTTHEVKQFNT